MMELECFWSAIGMASSMIALISSSLDQRIMDSAVHSTLWLWKSSCKILICNIVIGSPLFTQFHFTCFTRTSHTPTNLAH